MPSFLFENKNIITFVNLFLTIITFCFLCYRLVGLNLIPTDFQSSVTRFYGYYHYDNGEQLSSKDNHYSNWIRLSADITPAALFFIILLLNVLALSCLIAGQTVMPGLILPANIYRYSVIAINSFAIYYASLALFVPFLNLPWLVVAAVDLVFVLNSLILFGAKLPQQT